MGTVQPLIRTEIIVAEAEPEPEPEPEPEAAAQAEAQGAVQTEAQAAARAAQRLAVGAEELIPLMVYVLARAQAQPLGAPHTHPSHTSLTRCWLYQRRDTLTILVPHCPNT